MKKINIIDWLITLVIVVALIISFLVSEVKYQGLFNIIYWIIGIVGVLYLLRIILVFFFDKIKFDRILVKDNFLHKVINVVLLFPLLLTFFFVVFQAKPKPFKNNDKDYQKIQKSLAKELGFSGNLYAKEDTVIYISDTINIKKAKIFAQMMDWEIRNDSAGNYYLYKEFDVLPDDVVDDATDEPSVFWSVFYHYIDPGNQHISATAKGRRWSSLIAISGFFLLNGLLIAVLIGWFDRRRDEWIKGEVRYDCFFKRRKHYVIIGGNDMVSGIVKHLLAQTRNDSSYILIQTSKDVEQFRRKLYSELTDEQQESIVIYYGNRTSKIDIDDLKLNTAEEIYVLGESLADDGQNHDAYNMDCMRLITDNLHTACNKKNVYVIFENHITFSSFQFSDISISDKEKINYIPLNYYEMWAQKIFAFSDPTGIIKTKKDEAYCNHEYYPLDMIVDNENKKVSYISKDDPHYVHLVVIGMSRMGVTMGLEAAHVAHYPNALTAKGPRTRITFIDENADRESGYVMNRYSDLFALSRWRYVDAKAYNIKNKKVNSIYADYDAENTTWHDPLYGKDPISPYKDLKLGIDGDKPGDEFFIDIEWEFIKGGLSDFSVQQYLRDCADKAAHPDKILTVAVCIDEPHQSIAGGLYLPDTVYENALQVLVYQRFSDSILKYIAESVSCGDDGRNVRYKNVKPFGMLHETFSSICADDYLPKLVNYVYNIEYKIKKENGSYDWTVFDEFDNGVKSDVDAIWNKSVMHFEKGKSGCAVRWSNIYNANSIRTKLRSVKWDGNNELGDDTIKIMAITEHNRWNVEQLLMHYSPVRKDDMDELERLNKSDRTEYKQKKDEQKRKMRHIDICSYNRLNDVDAGVEKYDKALSESLPYLIKVYNEIMQS